jgi:DNA polymerase
MTTFAIADIGWLDFETKSDTDIKAGTYRYATEADAIVLVYAIGNGPVTAVTVATFDDTLSWDDMPEDFKEFHLRVVLGSAHWAAWNAGFDKAIWNYATDDFPDMPPHHIIDVMAQAVASGLPPDLAKSSALVGQSVKIGEGKDLIKLFCTPGGLKGVRGTPQSHPDEWIAFLGYAMRDVEAMRSVFKATRQLSLAEWKEYWAMEAVNERGIGIDVAFAERAAKLAEEDKVRSAAELKHLTGGAVETVDQVAKLVAWLLLRLPSPGKDILTKREEEVDDDGVVTKPAKFQLTRKRIERLLAYLNELSKTQSPQGQSAIDDMIRVLQIRQYGGSKTPAKFGKMLQQHVDGVLYGQYVFNGAAQTGRASSKGVQIHNLARDTIKNEAQAIDAILAGCEYEMLDMLGDDTPVARKLSLLIRPTFIAGPGNVFVWSDWSQIEARVLPWLCDHMTGAKARLEIFRAVDADPSVPDIYTRTAATLSGLPIAEVTKPIRQRGKVAELALGFCGGVGALQQMAAGYGLHFSDDEAKIIVDRWREANPWAQDYSRQIWEGMRLAMTPEYTSDPDRAVKVGRVWLKYDPHYFGGSLLARLPSGRVLTYRSMRWEDVPVLDADDQPTGIKKLEMTFARGYGRVKLWPGMFVENFTQATAADFLRGALVRLNNRDAPVRLHTHDEILLELPVEDAEVGAALLKDVMRCGYDWSEGLPINSEETIAYTYTKSEEGHGL